MDSTSPDAEVRTDLCELAKQKVVGRRFIFIRSAFRVRVIARVWVWGGVRSGQ